MARKKTAKFTYEGSSKPIKFLFLMGLIPIRWGAWMLLVSIVGFVFEIGHVDKAVFLLSGLVSLGMIVIGNIFVRLAQFLNWWDRGSVNSKIFKKL
jgi:hypothetical protein